MERQFENSTEPPSTTGELEEVPKGNYAPVRYNAVKHGILSTQVVLPHEDEAEFSCLLAELVQEHLPAGPTEMHLVEELAAIMWRKRRIILAENAKINKTLHGIITRTSSKPAKSAVPYQRNMPDAPFDWVGIMKSTPEEVERAQREATEYRQSIEKILDMLRKGRSKAYDKAVKAMTPDDRETWKELLEEEQYSPDAEGFREYIDTYLWPIAVSMEIEALHHFAIKNQTLGEGLQPVELQNLSRYETHLDRKLQRILSMLVKLKEIR